IFSSFQQLPNGTVGPAYTYSVQYFDQMNERARSGAGLKFDYKLSNRSRFSVNFSLNKIVEHEVDHYVTWSTNQGVATLDAAGNPTGTNGIMPGYTEAITQVRATTNSIVTILPYNAYKDGKTGTVQFNGVHRFKNLNIDYDGYRSRSKTNYAGQRTLNFIDR